jgi:dTDP-4-amino-4,6-dideoxygalactose transaminase
MASDVIPFNRPYATGKDPLYAAEALLTHSRTSALDLAALLLDIEPGDEVILPSYTFVSTANAFVLRGAVPCDRAHAL